ncbi:MAG: Holliday junction branch migration protein RuvA [Anaerolineae bacterium]|nr:Holliday junction branch migration protein RuvA [Anaerolineae bacterium]
MIASLHGLVAEHTPERLTIVVGGVGLEVFVTRGAAEMTRAGETVFLPTRLIVREDALTLYGFASATERDMFDTLLKVSGVGPRLAAQILSYLSTDNLRNAVASERPELITRVPGIGKKTAAKILLELKDKLPAGLNAIPVDGFDDINGEVMDALVGLGFSIVEAQQAIQGLPQQAPRDIQERIRLALQGLGR